MYCSPRDTVAMLQAQHRNLRCAKHGGCDSTECSAQGCQQEESQQHLVTCGVIKTEYWEEVCDYLETFGLPAENTEAVWIGGVMGGEVTSKEHAGIRAMAWRKRYTRKWSGHAYTGGHYSPKEPFSNSRDWC